MRDENFLQEVRAGDPRAEFQDAGEDTGDPVRGIAIALAWCLGLYAAVVAVVFFAHNFGA